MLIEGDFKVFLDKFDGINGRFSISLRLTL